VETLEKKINETEEEKKNISEKKESHVNS